MLYKDDIKAQERRKRFYHKHREQAIQETAEWRDKNREHHNQISRERNAIRRRIDSEFREKERQRSAESYLKFKELRLALARKHRGTEASKARELVRTAIRQKIIIKPSHCSSCSSSTPLQAHHDDYSQPLAVRWLCAFCHGEAHQRLP